jgi:uncharacterized membrane protein YccF (DUF307 family)
VPALSILPNILWFALGGFIVSLAYILGGIPLCITIIGIPFATQHLKMTRLAILPFGFRVVDTD